MQGPYSVTFSALAVTAAIDLFHITVATEQPVTVAEIRLGQTTDLGDAAEEVLMIGLYYGVTGGSGGTAATEQKYGSIGSASPTAAVITGQGTASTGGTLIDIIPWNIRVPLWEVPIPELRPTIDTANDPFVYRLIAAPADSITVSGTIKWFEGP